MRVAKLIIDTGQARTLRLAGAGGAAYWSDAALNARILTIVACFSVVEVESLNILKMPYAPDID